MKENMIKPDKVGIKTTIIKAAKFVVLNKAAVSASTDLVKTTGCMENAIDVSNMYNGASANLILEKLAG